MNTPYKSKFFLKFQPVSHRTRTGKHCWIAHVQTCLGSRYIHAGNDPPGLWEQVAAGSSPPQGLEIGEIICENTKKPSRHQTDQIRCFCFNSYEAFPLILNPYHRRFHWIKAYF